MAAAVTSAAHRTCALLARALLGGLLLGAFLAAFLATFFAAFFLATVTPPSRVLVELRSGEFHHRKLTAKFAWPML